MLQKYSIYLISGIFFKEPTTEHYLMEISRKTKIAHTSVKKHLETLTELNIIEKTIKLQGTRKYPIFKAKINNENYKQYKKIHNIEELTELIKFLKEKLMPKTIVLFGSYSRGEDIEDSDIDLFIESKKENLDLKKFEKKLSRKIQLHFNESFKKYPSELKNNIINGIIMQGYLEAA